MRTLSYVGKGGSLTFEDSNGVRRTVRPGETFQVDDDDLADRIAAESPWVIGGKPKGEQPEERVGRPTYTGMLAQSSSWGEPLEDAGGEVIDRVPEPEPGDPSVTAEGAIAPGLTDAPREGSGAINVTDLPAAARRGRRR